MVENKNQKKSKNEGVTVNQYFENQLTALLTNTGHFSEISTEKQMHYPAHLYKYRTCDNGFNFVMIEHEYLWADIPTNFSDPFDSLVNLQLTSELPKIQKWLFSHLGELLYYSIPPKGMPPHKNGQRLSNYIKAQEKFTDKSGRYNAQKAKTVMLLETKKLNPTQRQKTQKMFAKFASPAFESELGCAIKAHLENVVNSLRSENLVCCLTKRKDNLKMWEDYANKYSGFVIEYDIAKAIKNSDCAAVLASTFPVTYYKRLPKVPLLPFIQKSFEKELYCKDLDISEAERQLFKQLLIKKYDYRVEEEWRIISSVNRIPFPCISAIYTGQKIAENNLQKLIAICKKKNITLYRQKINSFRETVDFQIIV